MPQPIWVVMTPSYSQVCGVQSFDRAVNKFSHIFKEVLIFLFGANLTKSLIAY